MPPTTTTKSKKASSGATPPPWGRELMEKFGAGVSHAFILHGNVQDYVAGIPGQNLRDYLISSLAGRDIIVVYNRASGFYFPLPAHRRRFAEVVLGEVTTPNNRGGIAGALNGVAGGAAEEKIEQMGRQPLAALGLLTINSVLATQAPCFSYWDSRVSLTVWLHIASEFSIFVL